MTLGGDASRCAERSGGASGGAGQVAGAPQPRVSLAPMKPMQRQRGELIPIGEVVSGLDGPVKETREASPQARHHFTRADQVNQLPRRITTSARINFEHRKGTAWEPRSRTG